MTCTKREVQESGGFYFTCIYFFSEITTTRQVHSSYNLEQYMTKEEFQVIPVVIIMCVSMVFIGIGAFIIVKIYRIKEDDTVFDNDNSANINTASEPNPLW